MDRPCPPRICCLPIYRSYRQVSPRALAARAGLHAQEQAHHPPACSGRMVTVVADRCCWNLPFSPVDSRGEGHLRVPCAGWFGPGTPHAQCTYGYSNPNLHLRSPTLHHHDSHRHDTTAHSICHPSPHRLRHTTRYPNQHNDHALPHTDSHHCQRYDRALATPDVHSHSQSP